MQDFINHINNYISLTEEITLITNDGVTNETYQKAKTLFNDNHLAQIMMAIVTINAWDRVAISTQLQPA